MADTNVAIKLYKESATSKRVGINVTNAIIPVDALHVNGNIAVLGAGSRYKYISFYNNSLTNVGYIRYDSGNVTNVTTGRFRFQQYSGNSTASTTTSGYYESFSLPTTPQGLTESTDYVIITTKNISSIPDASTTVAGKVSTGDQEFAGTKTFPSLIIKQRTASNAADIQFNTFDDLKNGFVTMNTYGGGGRYSLYRFIFTEYSLSNTTYEPLAYYEAFRLPAPDWNRTANATYEIITTKNLTDIPDADASTRGLVSTGNQTFGGRKTMDLISPNVYDGTGNTSRYKYINYKNNAGTRVGAVRYDSGNATNVTLSRVQFLEYSPNSTANTGTTGYCEVYSLPSATSGLTADAGYTILTTKSVVTAEQGGTGKTTLNDAANALLNALTTGSSAPVDADYYIAQYSGGGTTTTSYHRRPTSALAEYMNTKITRLQLYEARATTTNLNKAANYGGAGAMFHLVATSATTTGKPPTDSTILQMNWDNNGGYDSQFGISTANNRAFYRSRPSEGTTWSEIAHITAGTAVGGVKGPTYVSSTGVVTACNTLTALATGKGYGFEDFTLTDAVTSYNYLLMIGKVTSSAPIVSTIIPIAKITTTEQLFQIADYGNNYRSVGIKKSGNNIVISSANGHAQSDSTIDIYGGL